MPLKLDAAYEGIFFDAPWYPEYAALWLWQAVRLSRPGTRIAFSLFPELTRPSASSERTELLLFAQQHGDVNVHKNFLCYHTPGFEAEILSRHDLSDLTSWRRSDLVEITLREGTAKPPPYPPPAEDKWDTYVIGSQVVKLRHRAGVCKPWLLAPVSTITDFLAETVSRRAPYRKAIDLWTSKNRVARVGDGVVMGAILAKLQRNGDLDAALNRCLPSRDFPPKSECALQIRAVLDLTG